MYTILRLTCLLCLFEKFGIVTNQNQKELLNKRSEVLGKCHNVNNFLLKNYTSNDSRLYIVSSLNVFMHFASVVYLKNFLFSRGTGFKFQPGMKISM